MTLPVPAHSIDALPAELAMLVRHGFDPAALVEAARLGRGWGVAPIDALLATRLGRADDVYRALAAETGLPFLEPGRVHVHARAVFPHAIASGVAPLAEPRPEGAPSYVLAPTGRSFADLLARAPRFAPGLSVTTPEALRLAVFDSRGEDIARLAAEDLARRRPVESFRDGLTFGQLVASHLVCAAIVLAAASAGGSAMTGASLLLGAPFIGLASIKLAAAVERVPIRMLARPARMPDRDLPIYTVLVPLYREGAVVEQLLGAIGRLDYPAGKLDVKLLVEQEDWVTAGVLAAIELPGFVEVVSVPRGIPRTKPRALNVGLALARGEYLVVFDAEDVPEPGQLRDAVAIFARSAPDVACLQARLVIDNARDSWLTRFFTLEYGALFDVVNPALARFDLPIPLGGTSNHLKTRVLRELGGWDPWNVTEDADLAVRLAVAGLRVADLPSATHEEAPITAGAWLAQRTRWMKGYAQVTITHSRQPIRNLGRLGLARLLGAAALIFGALLSAVVYPVFTIILAASAFSGALFRPETIGDAIGTSLAITTGAAGLLAMVVPPAVGAIRRRRWVLLPLVPLMPLYYGLVSLGAWRGLAELVLDPDRWNKTTHGLARTSWRESASEAGSPAEPVRSAVPARPAEPMRPAEPLRPAEPVRSAPEDPSRPPPAPGRG